MASSWLVSASHTERGARRVTFIVSGISPVRISDGSWPMISIERYAFYERAKQAYAVIQSGERRFYGCFAFRKGVIPPDAE